MTSYNTFEKFIETMQEEIFRLAVYKKLFTPYEIDNKFIDESNYEECKCNRNELQ